MSVSREREREISLFYFHSSFPSSFLSQLFVLPWLTVSFLFSGKWLGQRLALSILSQGVVSRCCCVPLSRTIFSNIEPLHRLLHSSPPFSNVCIPLSTSSFHPSHLSGRTFNPSRKSGHSRPVSLPFN